MLQDHFSKEMFYIDLKGGKRLRGDAVPTQFLFTQKMPKGIPSKNHSSEELKHQDRKLIETEQGGQEFLENSENSSSNSLENLPEFSVKPTLEVITSDIIVKSILSEHSYPRLKVISKNHGPSSEANYEDKSYHLSLPKSPVACQPLSKCSDHFDCELKFDSLKKMVAILKDKNEKMEAELNHLKSLSSAELKEKIDRKDRKLIETEHDGQEFLENSENPSSNSLENLSEFSAKPTLEVITSDIIAKSILSEHSYPRLKVISKNHGPSSEANYEDKSYHLSLPKSPVACQPLSKCSDHFDCDLKFDSQQKMVAILKDKNEKLEAALKQSTKLAKKLMEENDQLLKKVSSPQKIGMKWKSEAVKEALQLKFACGTSGYEFLLKQGMELPSVRTLQLKVQDLKFKSGILKEVFEMLKSKTSRLTSYERKTVLCLDEMTILPGESYDSNADEIVGKVTLPNHSGDATHALVFMLAGISHHWKQTVAYYFTPNSVDGSVFGPIIRDIIKRAYKIKLDVIAIVNDMGASNRKMWQ